MPTLKDIKQKIGGVKSTQQITRAMKLMSTAKLRRAMERLNATHFYLDRLEQIVADLLPAVGSTFVHPLFSPREVKTLGIVVISGTRGLCGSFNHEINKRAMEVIRESKAPQKKLLIIGKKAHEFFRRKEYAIVGYFPDLIQTEDHSQIHLVAKNAVKLFTEGVIDEMVLVYSDFVSVMDRRLAVRKLLPVEKIGMGAECRKIARQIAFDPGPEEILSSLVPRYLEGSFQRAVLESAASEHASRMLAMTNATDKAEEMIEGLTMQFNRTRQAGITKELSEVIAGADALSD